MRNENGFGSVICLDKSGKKRRKPWVIRVIVVNISEHKQKKNPTVSTTMGFYLYELFSSTKQTMPSYQRFSVDCRLCETLCE